MKCLGLLAFLWVSSVSHGAPPAPSPIVPGDLPPAGSREKPGIVGSAQRKTIYEEACEEKLERYKTHVKDLEDRMHELGPEGSPELVRSLTVLQGKIKYIDGQLHSVQTADVKSWERLKGILDEAFYDLDAVIADMQATLVAH